MTILCLHQSSELYGSDRSFLQVVKYLRESRAFEKICVALPRQGPLVEELEKLQVEVIFLSMSLLSKTYLKTLQWGKIVFPLLQFRKKMKLMSSYDILYVNTSVILDFYAFAPFLRNKKVLHIREIPSNWLGKILSYLIKRSNAYVIFNSFSTQKSFAHFNRSVVIHNSFEGFFALPPQTWEDRSSGPLKILLIGRINHWKGQDFAIEALSKLRAEPFLLRIVGSTFQGNEAILDELKNQVQQLQLSDKVEFIDFMANTQDIYQWADLVIVPSKKPEPFGRIAIEAMSLGKPVVAANHGGLPEIVDDKKSGFLFQPNDIQSFIDCIRSYLANRDLLRHHGTKSLELFQERFSTKKMNEKLDEIFKRL